MKKADLSKFIRFAIVGAVGFVIDMGVTYLLKERLGLYPYFANAAGFSVAVINNYVLNKYWTFEKHSSLSAGQFAGFLTVSLAGLLLNTLLLLIFFGTMRLDFYFSKIIATGMVMIWNFLANKFFIFSKPLAEKR